MKNFFNKIRKPPRRDASKRGVTAIEILFVLAIIAIIVAVVSPQFSRIRENQVLQNTLGDIISALNKAQSKTLSSVNSLSYGVHFQSDKVIIFEGIAFTAGEPANEEISILTPASISDVTLGGVSGPDGDIFFNRLSGSPNQTGTVTVSTSSSNKVISISAAGTASAD